MTVADAGSKGGNAGCGRGAAWDGSFRIFSPVQGFPGDVASLSLGGEAVDTQKEEG